MRTRGRCSRPPKPGNRTGGWSTRAFERVLAVFEALPVMARESMTVAPHPDQRDAAALSLAGWAAASLRAYPRLREHLREDALGQALPGAAVQGWLEGKQGEPLKQTRARIARALARETAPPREVPRSAVGLDHSQGLGHGEADAVMRLVEIEGIAAATGLKPGTVYALQHRIRQKLRAAFARA